MKIAASVHVDAPKEVIWKIITDVDNWEKNITAIESIEILERHDDNFIGLKWKETRTMFGKKATEIMWITHAEENSFYKTRAESHGAIYITTISITEKDNGCDLAFEFNGQPQSFGAKLMTFLM